jgi:hypothetical protein
MTKYKPKIQQPPKPRNTTYRQLKNADTSRTINTANDFDSTANASGSADGFIPINSTPLGRQPSRPIAWTIRGVIEAAGIFGILITFVYASVEFLTKINIVQDKVVTIGAEVAETKKDVSTVRTQLDGMHSDLRELRSDLWQHRDPQPPPQLSPQPKAVKH